ncbi:MAG TPA: carboxylate-amine ligase [Rhizobiales bacterium]|nr:carboxylate-amine ligase [Hyphomicrobiales bacterium]
MANLVQKDPKFTLGIEEEYLLVDKTSRDLVREAPAGLMNECAAVLAEQVSPEFLQCQIEIGTRVCETLQEARQDLARLRSCIADIAGRHNLAPIAASTHPFADWLDQQFTNKERYTELAKDLQGVGRRMLICGMHVHVGIVDPELRIDVFNQLPYFLPHLLALSTSSPFWQGRDTGLNSYRLTIFDNLPRTGLPPRFDSYGEYERSIAVLIDNKLIEDASKIWWDLRPSHHFPTLEMRICDVPTRLDHTISIAALYVCIVRMLYRLRRDNLSWRKYERFLINENRWRAQRYGTRQGLIDFGRRAVIPFADLLDEMIELVHDDAEALGCVAEIKSARDILANGSSADRQRKAYDNALAQRKSADEALKVVVDMLIEETIKGTT